MIGFSGGTASYVVWAFLIGAVVAWELFTVYTEKRWGFLPLTRIVRDRLMRKFTIVKLGGLLLLTWLWVHFVTPLSW